MITNENSKLIQACYDSFTFSNERVMTKKIYQQTILKIINPI